MNNSKRTAIITIILAIVFFITGFYNYAAFIEWMLPKTEGVSYSTASFSGQFTETLEFSLLLALIPVVISLIWKSLHNISVKQKIISACIIIVFVAAAALLRRQLLINEISYFPNASAFPGKNLSFSVPIENLHINLFLLIGLLAGSMLAYFIFKKTNKDDDEKIE